MVIRPPGSGAWTPEMILISVDLPDPFSPTRQCTSPASSVMSTSRSACTPPKRLEMLWRERKAVISGGASREWRMTNGVSIGGAARRSGRRRWWTEASGRAAASIQSLFALLQSPGDQRVDRVVVDLQDLVDLDQLAWNVDLGLA